MQIDWFTLIAQIVNFLILVALLKMVAYKPILNAMAQRKERVGAAMREAREKTQQAEAHEKQLREEKEELERRREKTIAEAREAADKKREELMKEAREEADRRKTEWHEALKREKDAFVKQLQREAATRIYQALARTLSDLADADLEDRIVEAFLAKLRDMGEDQRNELTQSAGKGEAIVVRTAFQISDDRRKQMAEALGDAAGAPIFEHDDDLVAGIELRAGGRKIAWSVAEYLDGVGEKMFAELDA